MAGIAYRKRPVIIEAFEWTTERRYDNAEWPNWLNQAWNKQPKTDGSFFCLNASEDVYIGTLEGVHHVAYGDFIIRGVQGELYPCKPDIFHATYERVI